MENTNNLKVNKSRLSLGLYFNYFIHGFALIIIAQNMISLSHSWQTTIAVVSYVISGVGIGRLISYPISGFLADHLNRKILVYLGMVTYFIFAVGMAFTTQIWLAYIFTIFAGIGNSLLDAGTYPTLVEINNGEGHGTVLLKAYISAGEFILPLLVTFLKGHELWYGWSFIAMASLIVLNFLYLLPVKFPTPSKNVVANNNKTNQITNGRKATMTVALLGYGYTSMALMILFTQWITLYAKNILKMSDGLSHFLLSLYSIGSIIGVLVLFFLLKKKISESIVLITLNLLAVISLLLIIFTNNTILTEFGCILFGFSAAGGVMQVGLTLFMSLYPMHHGTITGSFYFFGSIASFTIPLITGFLSKKSIADAFNFDLVIGLIGLALIIVIILCKRTEKEPS